jgi:hypothetical protein
MTRTPPGNVALTHRTAPREVIALGGAAEHPSQGGLRLHRWPLRASDRRASDRTSAGIHGTGDQSVEITRRIWEALSNER